MKLSAIYTTTALGAFSLAAVVAFASVTEMKIPAFRKSDVVEFRLPTVPDSCEAKVNVFKTSDLLKSVVPDNSRFWRNQSQDWTTILPDTVGVYHLNLKRSDSGEAGSAAVQKMAVTLRPDRYFKGAIKVTTPLAAAVYVNGEKIADKVTQDSVAGDVKGEIAILPYRDARVEIHFLDNGAINSAPEAKIVLEPAVGSEDVTFASDTQQNLFNIMTTVSAPRVSTVTVSPDGKYMIVAVTETADGKKYVNSYDVRECATGRVTSMNYGDGMSWLPGQSSTLYYNRDNADGTFDIVTVDYPSLKSNVLATGVPSEARHYVIDPTGKYLVFDNSVEGAKPSGTMRRLENPDDRMPGNRDRVYLSMIRFDERIVRPLTYGGGSSSLADISHDGKRLLYLTTRETPSVYPFYDISLVELDVNTLRCDTLLRHEPSIMTACYSPDDSRIFLTAGPSFYNGIGAAAGAHPIANDFDIQGYIYDIKRGNVRAVTRDFDPSITGDPVWNKADGKVYFRAVKGFDIVICSLDPNNGNITTLPAEMDYIRNFSMGENESRYLAYCGMSYDYMGRACMLDIKSGRNYVIADPASDLIAATDFGDSRMWSFTAQDGTEIEGTVTLPPGFDPNRKYPLIVYYYAGTTPSTHTNHSPYSPPLFASYGYVVYALNPSGAIGYGQEFSARHVNAWGERTADEIIYGTKLFCESHPFVDSTHIGCIGASYGGFMTQLLTARTDIFAAAVSHAGISNVASYWGEGYWGYSYNAVAAAKSYPWSNPEIFTRNSSLFNADKIHTPLLLLHGTVDTNVPIGESIQLYNALKILGRDVEFVTVEGENHIVMDFEKRKEWHNTIMAWFEKWLKGDSRWWDSIYN
ncbi:MAG: prolyl oligopeptidase family serine peptidase [Muribaculaceae bacterium]|nr:prolyl oligopeptidase family serine peptidase [Muribaculaceae bacterium]